MRIQMCILDHLWELPGPSPTDLSALSRVRPEKSKKLRYSPATSLLNSLLSGEHGVSMRSKAQQTVGGTWAVAQGTPTLPPNLPTPRLPSPAGQSSSDSSTLDRGSGRLPRGGDVSGNIYRK